MADNLTTTAKRIATQAHAGQTDKAGHPYSDHPSRVAARLIGDEEAEAAA
jgi:(p)ppGpp synthase/HD superfamily hydrolase